MIARAAAAAVLAVLVTLAPARAQTPATTPASTLFAAGDFDGAAQAYAAALHTNPHDAAANVGLGAIELYRNHLDAAATALQAALAAKKNDRRAAALLEEVRRRQDLAKRRVAIAGHAAIVPMIAVDPLPVVRVKLDGGTEATFLVDTGAPDIVLAPELAKQLGVGVTSAGNGTFAGGKQAAMTLARVPSIALGDAVAYDVDAAVMPVPQFVPNVTISGIVGTGLLERFLATIDYPNRRLVLRLRNPALSESFQNAALAASATIVPCWLVGDHFVFARGQVNAAPPGLFLFDSGLAGGGLLPSDALVTAAHLMLDRAHASTGVGGGGTVTAIPFVAGSIAVGDAVQHDVPGLYTPEGNPFGIFPFTVDGAISHDYLKNYAYTVDFDAMTIVLAPAGTHANP